MYFRSQEKKRAHLGSDIAATWPLFKTGMNQLQPHQTHELPGAKVLGSQINGTESPTVILESWIHSHTEDLCVSFCFSFSLYYEEVWKRKE